MKLTLYGEPRSKKNSMQIARVGNRALLIQSKQYRQYEHDCGLQITGPMKQEISTPVIVKATFYRSTRRRVDVTNLEGALLDVLVKYGVLSDDNRDIVAGTDGSRVMYDKVTPRTEVEILPLEGYEQWK